MQYAQMWLRNYPKICLRNIKAVNFNHILPGLIFSFIFSKFKELTMVLANIYSGNLVCSPPSYSMKTYSLDLSLHIILYSHQHFGIKIYVLRKLQQYKTLALISNHMDVMKLNYCLSRGVEEEPSKSRPAQLDACEVPLILFGIYDT